MVLGRPGVGNLMPPGDDWIAQEFRRVWAKLRGMDAKGYRNVADITSNDAGGTLHYSDGTTAPIALGSQTIYGATLTVTPSQVNQNLDQGSVQLTAKFHSAQGTATDVTSVCTWTSTNNAVATVDSGGLVTFHSSGSVYVLAQYTASSTVYGVEAIIQVNQGTLTTGPGGPQAGALTSNPLIQSCYPLDVYNMTPASINNIGNYTNTAQAAPSNADLKQAQGRGCDAVLLLDTSNSHPDPAEPTGYNYGNPAYVSAWFIWKCPATASYTFYVDSYNLTIPLINPLIQGYKKIGDPNTFVGTTIPSNGVPTPTNTQYWANGSSSTPYAAATFTAHAGEIYYLRVTSSLFDANSPSYVSSPRSGPSRTGYTRFGYKIGSPLS